MTTVIQSVIISFQQRQLTIRVYLHPYQPNNFFILRFNYPYDVYFENKRHRQNPRFCANKR